MTCAQRGSESELFHGAKCCSAQRYQFAVAGQQHSVRRTVGERKVSVQRVDELSSRHLWDVLCSDLWQKTGKAFCVPLDPLLYCKQGHWLSWGDIFRLQMGSDSRIISSRPQNNTSSAVNLGLRWAGVGRKASSSRNHSLFVTLWTELGEAGPRLSESSDCASVWAEMSAQSDRVVI